MLVVSWGMGAVLKLMAETQAEAAPIVFFIAIVAGTIMFIVIKSMFGQWGKGDAAQKSAQVIIIIVLLNSCLFVFFCVRNVLGGFPLRITVSKYNMIIVRYCSYHCGRFLFLRYYVPVLDIWIQSH